MANGIWGVAAERVSVRLIGAFTILVGGLLSLYFLAGDSVPEALVFASLFGLATRGLVTIIAMLQADYFGKRSFGAISGFSSPFQRVAIGLGPIVAALLYDFGNDLYDLAFIMFAAFMFLGALAFWFARRPDARAMQQAAQ